MLPSKFDCKRPHEWVGQSEGDADFLRQDGVIYAWSESNLRYEPAWWLSPDVRATDLTKNLKKRRPGPTEEQWQPSREHK